MLGNLLGNLFDKEEIVRATIQKTLINVSEELKCSEKELFIMIKPCNEDFDFKCYVYKLEPNPKAIREISLKEILGDANE